MSALETLTAWRGTNGSNPASSCGESYKPIIPIELDYPRIVAAATATAVSTTAPGKGNITDNPARV